MPQLTNNDTAIKTILEQTKIIAVVGHSHKPSRASYQVAQFLRSVGYIVYPVNPTITTIDNQPCYPSLKEIPESVDLVNVFRNPDYLDEIVDETIAINAKTLWTQLGIYNVAAEEKAFNAGLNVIMDACIKIEYQRLKSQSIREL